MTLEQLNEQIESFVTERDWRKFHSPKNLSMAMSIEASEVMEHFQWLTEEESRNIDETKRKEVADELGDVFIYLLRICAELQLDLVESAALKLRKNGEKYPADIVRGSSKKYTEY